jgi:hypothetical protein
MVVVATREGLVVLVELCSAASVPASMSAAGAAANPFDGVTATAVVELVVGALVELLVELLVVVTVVTLLTRVDTAATRGTAVHRRPLSVVRKAPDGSPLDAIFRSQCLFDIPDARSQPPRTKKMGMNGIKIHNKNGFSRSEEGH